MAWRHGYHPLHPRSHTDAQLFRRNADVQCRSNRHHPRKTAPSNKPDCQKPLDYLFCAHHTSDFAFMGRSHGYFRQHMPFSVNSIYRRLFHQKQQYRFLGFQLHQVCGYSVYVSWRSQFQSDL